MVFVFMLLAGNAVEDVVGASVDSSTVDDNVLLIMDDRSAYTSTVDLA